MLISEIVHVHNIFQTFLKVDSSKVLNTYMYFFLLPIFCFYSYFYISIHQGNVLKQLSDGLDGVGRQCKQMIVFQVLFHIQKYFSHKTKTAYLFNDYKLVLHISITVGKRLCAGTTRLWTCIQTFQYNEHVLRSLRLSVVYLYT